MTQKPEYEGRWTKDEGRIFCVYRPSSIVPRILVLSSVLCFLFSLAGCDAFVRKFTRKPKKENLPKEEMVLVPQEYKALQMTKEELYLQYFLFWKSWHDELIVSLSAGANHKKQISCATEAIKELLDLRTLLNEERQKKLDIYINQLNDLRERITGDLYGNSVAVNRQNAEQIKRGILREFSYKKISKDIK